MVAIGEQYSADTRQAPPGSIFHLENFIDIPAPKFFAIDARYDRGELQDPDNPYAFRMAHQNDRILAKFLNETEITRTIGSFTKRLQTYRPTRTGSLELDTRLLEIGEAWIPTFRSMVTRPRTSPFEWTMFIHGQPQPWEIGMNNFSYDILLPINIDYSYDPGRKAYALLRDGEGTQAVYDQAAYLEYSSSDPNVMIECLRRASFDLSSLVRFAYERDQVPWYARSEDELNNGNGALSPADIAPVIANMLKYL